MNTHSLLIYRRLTMASAQTPTEPCNLKYASQTHTEVKWYRVIFSGLQCEVLDSHTLEHMQIQHTHTHTELVIFQPAEV